ncbi:hypothetical protein ABGB12_34100 [Actinocorallia sp. B10E7]|uniref:hypothetical protein n=1 Tax=Actinocorallia sp. B10E7 TaxID=3153558 RepID=UPI00325F92CC
MPWAGQLGGDPRQWVLSADDPAARWVILTGVLGRTTEDLDVVSAHREALTDVGTADLLGRLPDWEGGDRLSGHNSPAFAPNLLNLLADLGVRGGEDAGIERLLDQMLAHQEPTGRFPSFGAPRGGEAPVWGALLCDSHAILEVLVRYGRADDPRTRAGLDRLAVDLADTAQGRAWPCVPHPVHGFRGPGRKGDFCPQVTLQGLRVFARLPEDQRPPELIRVARVALRAWRMRGTEKPYMFGHGKAFKTVKWPVTWYGAYAMLDTLGRFPALWRGAAAEEEDRSALAELAACLIAYNVGAGGTVVPRSVYQGWAGFSFGRKREPSPLATAWLLKVLCRLDDLAPEAAAVDVRRLPSSKGGTGTVVPPPG